MKRKRDERGTRGNRNDTAGRPSVSCRAPWLRRYHRRLPCTDEDMPTFWIGTIFVILLTIACFGIFYWFMMFRPARKRQSKPDHRA